MRTIRKFFAMVLITIVASGFLSLQAQMVVDCFPYTENFDGENTCSSSCGAACALNGGWENDLVGDTQDWTVWSGATTSSLTGPSSDHTSGSGNYIYMESSSPCFGQDDTAHVVSPIIDASGVSNIGMVFWRHMYGSTMGNLHVDVRVITGGTPGPWTLNITTPYTGNLNAWVSDTLNLSTYAGSQFQIRFRGTSGTNFYSDMALDDISFFTLLPLDISASAVTSPTNPVVVGANSFAIDVINFGITTVSAFTVNWTINGTPQTPANFSGTLAPGGTTNLALGSGTLPAGNSTVRFWTTAPNGGTDLQACNDTLEVTFCTPLSGPYSVGPGLDYDTPMDAAIAVQSCGVSGPVVFNITPGVYAGMEFLSPVPGASPTNTITFNGSDTSLVRLTQNGGNTVLLSAVDFVTLRNMTIENSTTAAGVCVMLSDTADFNHVDSCRIMVGASTSSLSAGIVSSANSSSTSTLGISANNITISNCTISGGYYGIRLNGRSSVPPYSIGATIENNIFENVYLYNTYLYGWDTLNILNNVVGPAQNAGGDGFYLLDVSNYRIESNDISDQQDYALYISDGNFGISTTVQSTVINNFISSRTDRALYFDDVENTNVFHNTCYGTYGFYVNDLININIQNNIFSGSTYAVYSLDNIGTMSGVTWNYNIYHALAGATGLFYSGGTNYGTLANLQTGVPAQNANSLEGDPFYVNAPEDLHLAGGLANDSGNNGLGIVVDIDGETRPQAPSTIVDIGADEYTPLSDDMRADVFLSPTGILCGDSLTEVWIVISNLGQSAQDSIPVTVNVTGDITNTLSMVYTTNMVFSQTDTVLVGTLNTYNGGYITLNGYVHLPSDQDNLNDTLHQVNATFIPNDPQGGTTYGCGQDSVDIYGVDYPGIVYEWYATATDTVPIASGDTFTVPNVLLQSTYYLQYQSGTPDSLNAGFAPNNSSNGNMFDIVGVQNTTITGVSMYLNAGTHTNVQVWVYRGGSFQTNPNSPAGWTQLGIVPSITVPVTGLVRIPITFAETVGAGQTIGFYVLTDGTNGYYNGTAVGNLWASDAHLQILEGVGRSTPLFTGSTFSPRNFVGSIHYGTSACSSVRVPVTAVRGNAASVNLGADTTVCGDSLLLDVTSSAYTSYMWSNMDTTGSISVDTTGAYSIMVTDTNGCAAMDTIGVSLFANPVVDLGPDSTVCNGTSVMLDAGYPGSTYSWNTSDTTQMITVGGGTYDVQVTDVNGCTDSDSVTITEVGPTVNLGADSLLCDAASLTLDAGAGSTSYSWSTSDTTQTISVMAPGAYSVIATDANGCTDSDTINITNGVTPGAAFTYTTSGPGITYSFTNGSSGSPTSYSWDFGDGSTPLTGANVNHTYTTDGTYTVCLTVSNDCGTDSTCETILVVGMDEAMPNVDFNVYPNPNNGQFFVELTGATGSAYEIIVHDLAGKIVHRQVTENAGANFKGEIQLNAVTKGIYFVKVISDGTALTKKISVE